MIAGTYFAPAQRTERRAFKNQLDSISHSPIIDALLTSMSGLLIVLNEDRQIVALNHSFMLLLGISDPEAVLGLRLGESLGCVHAAKKPNGCGTTPMCRTCGAVIAMMAAIEADRSAEQICALTAEKNGVTSDLCLLVKAKPRTIEDNRWILIFAQDITHQQFLTNLEQVFFHDINNILLTLRANAQLLARQLPENNRVGEILAASRRLSGEISIQQGLSLQQGEKYPIRNEKVSLKQLKKEIDLMLGARAAFGKKELIEIWPQQDVTLRTDILLVSRVLGNMLINALEATENGGVVKLTTRLESGGICWEVWNEAVIDSNIQRRIFQRHFSTKAKTGRGLGTYSMKLFGEKYLHGKVDFFSTREKGTSFTFRLPLD